MAPVIRFKDSFDCGTQHIDTEIDARLNSSLLTALKEKATRQGHTAGWLCLGKRQAGALEVSLCMASEVGLARFVGFCKIG